MEHGQARVVDVVHAVRSVEEMVVGKEGGGCVSAPQVASSQRQRDHVSCDVAARSLATLITVGGLLIGASRSKQSD